MMLGFPPPLFFQICWRFVSPAIIFVSSQRCSLLLLPLGQVFSWEPAEREQENNHPARTLPTALLGHERAGQSDVCTLRGARPCLHLGKEYGAL